MAPSHAVCAGHVVLGYAAAALCYSVLGKGAQSFVRKIIVSGPTFPLIEEFNGLICLIIAVSSHLDRCLLFL